MTMFFNLQWWEYPKVLGWLAMAVIGVVLSVGNATTVVELWLLAAMGHVVADYTLQSNWMAMGKLNKEVLPLLVHCLISGLIPALLVTSNPVLLCASVVVHIAVDWAGKERVGGLLGDQAIHLATYLVIIVISL